MTYKFIQKIKKIHFKLFPTNLFASLFYVSTNNSIFSNYFHTLHLKLHASLNSISGYFLLYSMKILQYLDTQILDVYCLLTIALSLGLLDIHYLKLLWILFFISKITYLLWKLPIVNNTVSVHFGTNTCRTYGLVFWVCFWFDCYFLENPWILLKIWLQKCCIFLSITNCICINISHFKSLLESSFTQLKCCIMWKFIQVDIVFEIVHVGRNLRCWDFS